VKENLDARDTWPIRALAIAIWRRGETTAFGAGPDAHRTFGAPGQTVIRVTDDWY